MEIRIRRLRRRPFGPAPQAGVRARAPYQIKLDDLGRLLEPLWRLFATSGSTFPLEPLGTLGTVWNPLGPFETPLNPFGDILPHLVALFWHFGDFLPNLVALFAASTSLFMVQLHSIASKLYL